MEKPGAADAAISPDAVPASAGAVVGAGTAAGVVGAAVAGAAAGAAGDRSGGLFWAAFMLDAPRTTAQPNSSITGIRNQGLEPLFSTAVLLLGHPARTSPSGPRMAAKTNKNLVV